MKEKNQKVRVYCQIHVSYAETTFIRYISFTKSAIIEYDAYMLNTYNEPLKFSYDVNVRSELILASQICLQILGNLCLVVMTSLKNFDISHLV